MNSITVVTPCLNEAANLRDCIIAVKNEIGEMGFDHIFIDNASTDDSLHVLVKLKEEFPHIRVLSNSYNVGVFSSIQRALREIKTEWVVPFFAADLQDPAHVIRAMIEVQKSEECDSVFAVRADRRESKALSILRNLFYRVLRNATKGAYVIGTSEFCLIRFDAIKQLIQLNDPNPFLRIYLSQISGNVRYVEYKMEARQKGKSSASVFSLVDDALNGLSLVLPSVFSRVLLGSGVSLIMGIGLTLYSVFDIFLLPFNREGLLPIGITLMGFSVLFGLVAVVGHYVYLIHNSLRAGNVATTSEL